ncbi:hypothetical protein [Burkholderia sp. WAC0059]|uniref:hypothetical protein n=1 Tax=Burkholderia sp. WAC0059 TaxID=2066022 RepID=UPI0011AF2ECA|nr:hypothetical protein [Burkholderia sp. WAC0059]
MSGRIAAAALAVCLGLALEPAAMARQAPKGKILIVLSSEHVLPLKDGKTFDTGYYLNELVVPARRFAEAGYTLVFATPQGNEPVVDQASISPDYFGGSRAALEDAQRYETSLTGLRHPLGSATWRTAT